MSLDTSKNINVKIVYNKTTYNISMSCEQSVTELKQKIKELTSVTQEMQKLVFKGKTITDQNKKLNELGIKNGNKVLMIGSTASQIAGVMGKPTENSNTTQELNMHHLFEPPLNKQYKHKKVIDKGVPQDAMIAYKNGDESWPEDGVSGLRNHFEEKVKISLKLELDEMWVCSEKKTYKYDLSQITDVVSEPIEGHDEYCIIDVRFKRSARIKLWIYWFPMQYLKAFKKAIHQ